MALLRGPLESSHHCGNRRVADLSEEALIHSLILDLSLYARPARFGQGLWGRHAVSRRISRRLDAEACELGEQRLGVPVFRVHDVHEGTDGTEGLDDLAVGRARPVLILKRLTHGF